MIQPTYDFLKTSPALSSDSPGPSSLEQMTFPQSRGAQQGHFPLPSL